MLIAGLREATEIEPLGTLGSDGRGKLYPVSCDLVSRRDLPVSTAVRYSGEHDCEMHAQCDAFAKVSHSFPVVQNFLFSVSEDSTVVYPDGVTVCFRCRRNANPELKA